MSIKRRTKPVEDDYLNGLLNDLTGLGHATADQLKKLEEAGLQAPYGTWLGGRYYVKESADSRWELLTSIGPTHPTI